MSLEPESPRHPEQAAPRRSYAFESKWVGSWLAPILVASGIFIWAFLIYGLIGHRERTWEYGTVPYVPGSSIYSTEIVRPKAQEPPQVVLPGQTQGGGNANSE